MDSVQLPWNKSELLNVRVTKNCLQLQNKGLFLELGGFWGWGHLKGSTFSYEPAVLLQAPKHIIYSVFWTLKDTTMIQRIRFTQFLVLITPAWPTLKSILCFQRASNWSIFKCKKELMLRILKTSFWRNSAFNTERILRKGFDDYKRDIKECCCSPCSKNFIDTHAFLDETVEG